MFERWNRPFDGDLIVDGLYLGSQCDDEEALGRHGITHILTVARDHPPLFPRRFEYLCVAVADTKDEKLNALFDTCHSYINEALYNSGRVFVHCAAGISRSATIVLSYLLKMYPERYATVDAAIAFVREKRPIIAPNPGFVRQLEVYVSCACVSPLVGSVLTPRVQHHRRTDQQKEWWWDET